MRHEIGNIISGAFSMGKLVLMKVIYRNRLHFTAIERLSPNVVLDIDGISTLVFRDKVSIHSGSRITVASGGYVEIGNRVRINNNCRIACRKKIIIEDRVEIGPNVLIYDHDHDYKCSGGLESREYVKTPVYIGEGSWIGAGTIILRGTSIGKNCVVGAGSVLKGAFPDNCLIVQKREDLIIKYNNRD